MSGTNILHKCGAPFRKLEHFLKTCTPSAKCSMLLMGLGQIRNKQVGKGILLILAEIAFIAYFALIGVTDFIGLFTLGTKAGDPILGIAGDNSITMLIRGVLAVVVLLFLAFLYYVNVRDANDVALRRGENKPVNDFKQSLRSLLDEKFYMVTLALPVVGVIMFNVLPIVFTILTAFTNYSSDIAPPKLVDWIGFGNFVTLFTVSEYIGTIGKIFVWNILWAVLATFCSYFGGLCLALLINKNCVKGRAFWRAFPILAYAVPGFITMIGFRYMFSGMGPINWLFVKMWGEGASVDFLGINSVWAARIVCLLVNTWVTIPASMLLSTSVLSNMNKDMYEAADLDGASQMEQFIYLTLPFVFFATMPILITQFIGNFNNFGISFFLRGGLMNTSEYFNANSTDLLINWLYNLALGGSNNYYGLASAVSILIFILTGTFSLIAYVTSPSYKREDTYK